VASSGHYSTLTCIDEDACGTPKGNLSREAAFRKPFERPGGVTRFLVSHS